MTEEQKPKATNIADEIAKMPVEEFLPVEKKLVAYSLILGVVLLAVLTWLSKTLFPS
jgi:hypothetical protein